jgi:hypothetical protein
MVVNSVEHVERLLLPSLLPKDPKESVTVMIGGRGSRPTVSNPDGGLE